MFSSTCGHVVVMCVCSSSAGMRAEQVGHSAASAGAGAGAGTGAGAAECACVCEGSALPVRDLASTKAAASASSTTDAKSPPSLYETDSLELARDAARPSAVLAKNDAKTLPLSAASFASAI